MQGPTSGTMIQLFDDDAPRPSCADLVGGLSRKGWRSRVGERVLVRRVQAGLRRRRVEF